MTALEKSLDRLLDFPLSGAVRETLAKDLRVVFHGAYAVYYRFSPDEILVLRVLHGARDVDELRAEGGFE